MFTTETVYVDPMIPIKEQRKNRNRMKKVELTGKEEAHCKDCNQTKDILLFDITPNRNRTKWKPRLICIPCGDKRRTKPRNKKKGSYRNNPKVKEWVHNSSTKASKLISDSYIRRLYNKLGYKAKDVTNEMIVEKRLQIIYKRASAANKTSDKKIKDGTYGQEERDKMTDGYIRGLIKQTTWYQGEEITDKMIQDYRDSVFLKRALRNKKIRKTEEKSAPYQFFVPKEFRN